MKVLKKVGLPLILGLLLAGWLSSCSTYTVPKGWHASIPFQFKSTKTGVKGTITVNESMRYILEGDDQFDFNKLVGLKFYYFKPMEETMMIGWRYLPEIDKVEFVAYQHYDGERIIHWDQSVLADIGDTLPFDIEFYDDFWYVLFGQSTFTYVYPYQSDKESAYRIVHWFRGNETAPHKIPIKFNWN